MELIFLLHLTLSTLSDTADMSDQGLCRNSIYHGSEAAFL